MPFPEVYASKNLILPMNFGEEPEIIFTTIFLTSELAKSHRLVGQ